MSGFYGHDYDDDGNLVTEPGDEEYDGPGASWRPVDLTAALDGSGNIDPPPVLLDRDDGVCLFYNGKVHTVSGESESLKTWFVLLACVTVINDGQHVLFIDYEDSAGGIVARLLALGVTPGAISEYFHYVRPDEPYTGPGRLVLAASVTIPLALVIIDGVTEAMSSHGLDPLSNADVAKFNSVLPKPFARTGAIVAMIDHVTKNREQRGRYAIGAQHKLSAVDGAAYIVELLKPFGRGLHGTAKIVVAKDRPGHVRGRSEGRVAGILHLRSEDDGSVIGSIAAPKVFNAVVEGAATAFRPTVLMKNISEFIEANPGMSGRAIKTAVNGKTDYKGLAMELLIREGYVKITSGPRNASLHYSVKPFSECDPDTPSATPTDTPGSTVPTAAECDPATPPLGGHTLQPEQVQEC